MKKFAVAVVTALSALTGTAHAGVAEGTGAVALLGVTGGPGSIGTGTTFDALMSLFSSGTGAFSNVPVLTPISHLHLTATTGSALDFSGSFGSFAGLVTSAESTGPTSNRVVNVIALGNFTPMGALSNFDAGAMSVSFSATQTGARSSVSASYTFWSVVSVVPELETYAMMLAGLGAVGFLVGRRKDH